MEYVTLANTKYNGDVSVTIIYYKLLVLIFFFSSRRRHTRLQGDWSSDVCSSDLESTTILPRQTGSTHEPQVVGSRPARTRRVFQTLPRTIAVVDRKRPCGSYA